MLVLASGSARRVVEKALVPAPIIMLLLIFFVLPPWSPSHLVSGPYKYLYADEAAAVHILNTDRVLYYKEGVTGTVAVKQRGENRFLTIGGKVEASSDIEDMATQILIGQIPMFIAKDPKDTLVIGLASGVTVGSVARHPVRRIDAVEISYEVKDAVSFFSDINYDVLSDERVHLIMGDGRNHLLLTDQMYDVIISEPSNPWMAGIGSLYTREFFHLAQKKLRPGGVMAQWVQTYQIPLPMLKSIIRTYADVFPHISLWLTGPVDLLILGSNDPLVMDIEEMKRKMRIPKVQADLERIGLGQWWHIIQRALAEGPILRQAIHAAPIHTDDRTFLEFDLPKMLHKNTLMQNEIWIEALMRSGASPSPFRGSVLIADEDRTTFARAQAAFAAHMAITVQGWRNVMARKGM